MILDLVCSQCGHCLKTGEAETYIPIMGEKVRCKACKHEFTVTKKALQKALTKEQRQKAIDIKAKAKSLLSENEPKSAGRNPHRLEKTGSSATVKSSENKPLKNMNETEYRSGLQVAALAVFFAYFQVFMVLIILVVSAYKGLFIQGLILSLGIIVFAMSMLLFGHTAKAIMKSADYLRIIAKRMD